MAEIERRLKMSFSDQCRAIATHIVQIGGHTRSISRQWHPIGPDAMCAYQLPSEQRGSARHADNVLIMGTSIVNARSGQIVHDRSASNLASITTKRIIALLIGSNEEDFASHGN